MEGFCTYPNCLNPAIESYIRCYECKSWCCNDHFVIIKYIYIQEDIVFRLRQVIEKSLCLKCTMNMIENTNELIEIRLIKHKHNFVTAEQFKKYNSFSMTKRAIA